MKRVDRRGFIWASALPEYILRSAAAPAHDPLQILPPRSISRNFFSLTGTGLRPSGCCQVACVAPIRPGNENGESSQFHSPACGSLVSKNWLCSEPVVTNACQGPIPPPQTSACRAGVYSYHLEGEDVEMGGESSEIPSPTAPTYVPEDVSNQARPVNFKPQAAAPLAQNGADVSADRPVINGRIPIATAAPGSGSAAIPTAQAYDPNHPGQPPQIIYIQGQNQPMSQDEIFVSVSQEFSCRVPSYVAKLCRMCSTDLRLTTLLSSSVRLQAFSIFILGW